MPVKELCFTIPLRYLVGDTTAVQMFPCNGYPRASFRRGENTNERKHIVKCDMEPIKVLGPVGFHAHKEVFFFAGA